MEQGAGYYLQGRHFDRAADLRAYKPPVPWKPNEIQEGVKRLNEADRLERQAKSSHPSNYRSLRHISRIAKVADAIEIGRDGINLIQDPTGENAYKFTRTCVGVWLMGQGPYGWAIKYAVIPNTEMAVEYVTATDRTGLAADAVKWERSIVQGMTGLGGFW